MALTDEQKQGLKEDASALIKIGMAAQGIEQLVMELGTRIANGQVSSDDAHLELVRGMQNIQADMDDLVETAEFSLMRRRNAELHGTREVSNAVAGDRMSEMRIRTARAIRLRQSEMRPMTDIVDMFEKLLAIKSPDHHWRASRELPGAALTVFRDHEEIARLVPVFVLGRGKDDDEHIGFVEDAEHGQAVLRTRRDFDLGKVAVDYAVGDVDLFLERHEVASPRP